MTVLSPNSRLGRAIRSGKIKAVKVDFRPGEDAGDAFVRGFQKRNPAEWGAFVDRIDAIIKANPAGEKR